MRKKICVVTGTRAEYGLLSSLMHLLKEDNDFQLQIVASAMHLSPEYGLTYRKILEDGFSIDEKVEMLLSSDTATGIAKSLGLGVISFADVFARLKPDLVILLGDRFESLAAAQAAFIATIPIAHIHGGELTMGAYDDGIRHSLTKMAHLHFVATKEYQQRVMQLGENPKNIHNVGAMVLDSVVKIPKVEKMQVEQFLGLSLSYPSFAITYQPETIKSQNSDFATVLEALAEFKEASFVFTKGNADAHCNAIYEMMDAFAARYPGRAKTFTHLGHENYLKLLQVVDVVVGNSSSGIIEAPFFKTPTVNIGDRQQGRARAGSIIDCAVDKSEIINAIQMALSATFKKDLSSMSYPYGKGSPAQKIVAVLKEVDFSALFKKQFFDLLQKEMLYA